MRLNDYGSRQYVVIEKNESESPELAFFDSKEERDEWKKGTNDSCLILFEGYVDIQDVEIYEHPDFQSFIKEEFKI